MTSVIETLDYSQVAVPSSTYRPRTIYPDAPVVGNLSSTFESSFTLPRQSVYNLARSELTFTLQAASAATAKNQLYADIGMLPFDRIQIRTERGLVLADYSYVRSVSRLRPFFQNYKDLIERSTPFPNASNALTIAVDNYGLQDGTTRIEPAGKLVLSDTAVAASAANGNGYKGYDGTIIDFEKAYGTYRQHLVSDAKDAAASTHMNVDYRIPLSEFFGISQLDKDMYFGSEALIINLTHTPINRIFVEAATFGGTDGATEVVTALAAGKNHCKSLALQLAIQSNNVLANNIMTRVNTEGLTISFPMVWVQRRTTDNTGSHDELMRLNISKGKYLQRVCYFLERDALATGFSNTSNNCTAAGVQARWSQVRSSVNSVWETDSALSAQQAYHLASKHLNDSMVISKKGWDRVGAHMVDYTSSKSPDEFNRRIQDACGLSLLQPIDLNTSWTKTSGAGTEMNVYTVAFCQRDIRVSGAGVMEA